MEEQYLRDVARVRGEGAIAEDDYKSFLRELGGAPPPELMGDLAGARKGLGLKTGRDLPDDCKVRLECVCVCWGLEEGVLCE